MPLVTLNFYPLLQMLFILFCSSISQSLHIVVEQNCNQETTHYWIILLMSKFCWKSYYRLVKVMMMINKCLGHYNLHVIYVVCHIWLAVYAMRVRHLYPEVSAPSAVYTIADCEFDETAQSQSSHKQISGELCNLFIVIKFDKTIFDYRRWRKFATISCMFKEQRIFDIKIKYRTVNGCEKQIRSVNAKFDWIQNVYWNNSNNFVYTYFWKNKYT